MNFKILLLAIVTISALEAHKDHTTIIIEQKAHKEKTTVFGDTCRIVAGSHLLALAALFMGSLPVITDPKFREKARQQEIAKLQNAARNSRNPNGIVMLDEDDYASMMRKFDNLVRFGVVISTVGAPITSYFGTRLLRKGIKGFRERNKQVSKK